MSSGLSPKPEPPAVQAPEGPVNRWADLRPRVLSAVVLLAVGALEVFLGGLTFEIFAVGITGIMIWELASLTGGRSAVAPLHLGLAAGLVLGLVLHLESDPALALLMVPSAIFVATDRRDRRLAAAYALTIMIAGFGLIELRLYSGVSAIIWVISVVIASDVLGYFAGRLLGGPKFWPRISPKKTWSGTVAGWFGAALIGAGFVQFAGADWLLVPLSVLVAFAGQMGDIAESWIKRRAGVKDASTLIPGHGGLLDRFDALIGAVVLVKLLGLVLPVSALLGG